MNGKYHEIRRELKKVADRLEYLERFPELYKKALELIDKYSPNHNPHRIDERELKNDLRKTLDILENIQTYRVEG
jgi:hypothetical protein